MDANQGSLPVFGTESRETAIDRVCAVTVAKSVLSTPWSAAFGAAASWWQTPVALAAASAGSYEKLRAFFVTHESATC